jgi:hypothetical protein
MTISRRWKSWWRSWIAPAASPPALWRKPRERRMNTLASLQRQLQEYLLDGLRQPEQLVLGDARAGAAERLGVYADAYRLRLLEALRNDYPALLRRVGTGTFERLGRAYIDAHPSDTPSVRWFGRHLAEFLRALPEDQARPAWIEIAAFEWARGEVFDAPDVAPLQIAELAAVPPQHWAGMRVMPQPGLRRLDLHWNIPALCHAYELEQKPPRLNLRRRALPWLLWRDAELDIRWRSLGADEAAALDAVREERSFGEICELLCRWVAPEEAAMHAAGLLKRWAVDGVLCGVETE